MTTYHDYLRFILKEGVVSDDRTGTGTISAFGYQMRFDLKKGFPMVTTKHVSFKSVASEILWMLSGSTNVKDLHAMGNRIWDPWANEDGDLGPVYGKQWVAWPAPFGRTINQLEAAIETIKTNPDSRRIIVSAWNVNDIPKMNLPPCHMLFQFKVENVYDHLRLYAAARSIDGAARLVNGDGLHELAQNDAGPIEMSQITRSIIAHYGDDINVAAFRSTKLSCRLDMRSSDAFIGMPYNIAGYALLTHLVAHQCGLDVGDLVIQVGDAHIYLNHLAQVNEQLARECRELPLLKISHLPPSLFEYQLSDLSLSDYHPHERIEAPIAV